MISGIGIDSIEVERINNQILKGNRFKERIFTPKEISYCESKKYRAQNYAACFSAKEAFLKALGTGWRFGLSHRDIEIVNDNLGKPVIVLYGKAKKFAEDNKITNIHVSLTHLKHIATAIVTVEK